MLAIAVLALRYGEGPLLAPPAAPIAPTATAATLGVAAPAGVVTDHQSPLPDDTDDAAADRTALAFDESLAARQLEDEVAAGTAHRPPLPDTERAYRVAFAARLARDPCALDGEIDAILAAGPDCRRVALLTELWRVGAQQAPRALAQAIRTLSDVATPGRLSVPSFAIRFLSQRAGTEARARDVLAQFQDHRVPSTASAKRARDSGDDQ